jgi:uncharacterized YigZ family protein
MKDSYITVKSSASGEFTIEKSRFIGYACPCASESEALSFLQSVRDQHHGATHHCYAYIIGENAGIMRYSDDGEPGGTAGLPIVEVMKSSHVVNCCVVVVRYFGGVLLGTGGLVRAYTQSARAAVDAAGIARMELTSEDLCEVPYTVWDKFRYAAEKLPVMLEQVSYGSAVSFRLLYRSCDRDEVLHRLMDASDRKLESLPLEESFRPWKIKA